MLAPITGKLRKRLILDLTVAGGLGTAGGFAYWYGYHIPAIRKREDYYVKLAAMKPADAAEET